MRVVLFDIDGTLVSTGGAGKAAMEAALVSEFAITSVRDGVPFSGRTDRAIGRDLFDLHGIDHNHGNWQRFVDGYLRHLPGCLNHHPGLVLPGIAPLLAHLQDKGDVDLGLLTGNLREGARLKLGHFDLFRYFAFGGFGDEHLHRDDVARDAVAAIARHFARPAVPEDIWVIGDTPLDIRCARAIGARVLAVGTGWHTLDELAAAGPDMLLPDLSDPAPFLDSWD
jgi:phosphoglycolate phosphatase-like HAD superfamily hydrolase